MQSTVFSLSPSLSLPKQPLKRSVSVSTSKLNVILTPSSFPCQPCSLAYSPSFKLAPSHFHPFHARATSVPESSAGNTLLNTLELGALFGLWILFNIYFNIYNKQVLKVYHFPLTVSTLQFAVGSLFVAFMWSFNLYKRPKVSGAQVGSCLCYCSIFFFYVIYNIILFPLFLFFFFFLQNVNC